MVHFVKLGSDVWRSRGIASAFYSLLCMALIAGCGTKPDVPTVAVDFSFLDDNSILLSSSDGKIYRSDDLGRTWLEPLRTDSKFDRNITFFRDQASGSPTSVWGVSQVGSGRGSFDVVVQQILSVTRDGGDSLVSARLPFEVAGEYFDFFRLIQIPNGDPLLFSSGTFYEHSFPSTDSEVSIQPIGIPSPERGRIGAACGDQMFVASISKEKERFFDDPPFVTWVNRIRRSSDNAETWEVEFESDEWFFALECSASGAPWLVTMNPERSEYANLYRRVNESQSWEPIVDLGATGLVTAAGIISLAGTDNTLFIAGMSGSGVLKVTRVSSSGDLTEYPRVPGSSVTRVRIDPSGDLWVAASGLYRWDSQSESWELRWPEVE